MGDEMEYEYKVVLITGSSGGLGAQMAKEFAMRGASVVITGRDANRVTEVADECDTLSPNGQTSLQVVGDITEDDFLKQLIEKTIRHFGKLNILINNAGIGAYSPIDDPKLITDFDNVFKLDVRSLVVLTQLSVPFLQESKGSIINMSSAAALKPLVGCSAYCMAKASVDMFTKCMALELGPKGIRVNSINPTAVKTGFQANTGSGEIFETFVSHTEKLCPLRKNPDPQDIANAVLFLSSESSAYITGISFPVDSGIILT